MYSDLEYIVHTISCDFGYDYGYGWSRLSSKERGKNAMVSQGKYNKGT